MALELLDHFSSSKSRGASAVLLLCATLFGFGCASQAPSIAHVHIGHAITGHASTPNNEGFFQLAEEQAQAAVTAADRLDAGSPDIKQQLSALSDALDLGEEYAFGESLKEAANHMAYAANSDDATPNVRASARQFEESIQGLLVRTELISLYINESKQSNSSEEAAQYVSEIQKMVRANLNGEDLDGSGRIGETKEEYGVRQLRRDIDAMIAAEYPPYRTVDRWYLFNLIRLPSGDWMFRRSKSGGSGGYQ